MTDKLISAHNVRTLDGGVESVRLYVNENGDQYILTEELEPAPKKEETNE